jgi:hypothetical protein
MIQKPGRYSFPARKGQDSMEEGWQEPITCIMGNAAHMYKCWKLWNQYLGRRASKRMSGKEENTSSSMSVSLQCKWCDTCQPCLVRQCSISRLRRQEDRPL